MTRHDHGSTGLCGLAWYDADQFPKEYLGCMFLGNVVTSRINFDQIEWHGATPEAMEQPDFLVSEDLWFRPVDIKLGPDGALYVSDFYNKIIGHYEVDSEAPRPRPDRGRIWRIVYTGPDGKAAPPKAPGDLTKMKREELDKLLGHPNITVRMLGDACTHQFRQMSKRTEQLEKVERKMSPSGYDAHKMWAEEAEPVVDRERVLDKRMKELRDETELGCGPSFPAADGAGRVGGRPTPPRLEDCNEKRRNSLKIGSDRTDRPGRGRLDDGRPEAREPAGLVDSLKNVAADDTHLRHALRIALRETLRDPAAWTALKASSSTTRWSASWPTSSLGLPTKDAADF